LRRLLDSTQPGGCVGGDYLEGTPVLRCDRIGIEYAAAQNATWNQRGFRGAAMNVWSRRGGEPKAEVQRRDCGSNWIVR
jgi:hypothetical protein